jgi:hypothetical protein
MCHTRLVTEHMAGTLGTERSKTTYHEDLEVNYYWRGLLEISTTVFVRCSACTIEPHNWWVSWVASKFGCYSSFIEDEQQVISISRWLCFLTVPSVSDWKSLCHNHQLRSNERRPYSHRNVTFVLWYICCDWPRSPFAKLLFIKQRIPSLGF